MLFCIMFSSGMLAAEDPLDSKSETNLVSTCVKDVIRYTTIPPTDPDKIRLLLHDSFHNWTATESYRLRFGIP